MKSAIPEDDRRGFPGYIPDWILPYIPLIIIAVLLILKPYYLFPTHGDIDFHLVRAREIMIEPLKGLIWDYMVYYPPGRPLGHPPLLHVILASLWTLGGVRFAHSIMCMLQILLTVFTASFVASRWYGERAGFIAGALVLASPRPDTLSVIMPAAYIPVLLVLTVYLLSEDRLSAAVTGTLALWTHFIALITVVPAVLADGVRRNLRVLLLLLPSFILWWAYFLTARGAPSEPVNGGYFSIGWLVFLILLYFGVPGFYLVRGRREFRPLMAYILIVLLAEVLFDDISRGLQYVALPLAIVGGYTGSRLLDNPSGAVRLVTGILIISSATVFVEQLLLTDIGWSDVDIPFENRYYPLKEYIDTHTSPDDVVWASGSVADKVAWMTGRRVSNGRYGPPPGFQETFQDLNIYEENGKFIINNKDNETIQII
ncbi:hypothetical protein FVF72_08785 [Methanothermobacter sp. KEPCO-1]|uniref:hypothetical protein n=1 Tax=Methanothermobacter sp. KEPCO-1 TaxID=2603820 RepID=UPI0011C7DF71|nr:hypothetical protein [Methanothermobacter sp. KEPCO-1]QEF95235.1 hypothetical protein FVF72_08785 [Methanothermobacter sp. KEPCO-1]